MRKIVVLCIALLMIGGTQAVMQAQEQGEQWAISATYAAPDSSVSIQYPKQWEVTPVTSVPGLVATFLTPSGSVNRMYGELYVGQYQSVTSLDDYKNYLISEPESNGTSLTPTQIAGHPAFRIDGPLADGATGTFAVVIDFDGTFVALNFQGGVEAPDDFDDADVAMILAMATSIQMPAGQSSPPTEATAAAAEPADALATKTFITEDGTYALTAPASWPWMDDPSGSSSASMWKTGPEPLSASISRRVNSSKLSMQDYLTTYWQKNLPPDSFTVTKLDLPGVDAAQGTYAHHGSGMIYLVAVKEFAIAISIYADDAVLRSQNAAILAMIASIVPRTDLAKSAAAYAAEFAIAPQVTAPPPTPTAVPVSCSVTASGTVNLRSGPGTSFAKAGSLAAGASQSVTGQATGSDSAVWYQLDGGYVRSDLVRADGDCASVPTVSP